jgi:hypothetical protein
MNKGVRLKTPRSYAKECEKELITECCPMMMNRGGRILKREIESSLHCKNPESDSQKDKQESNLFIMIQKPC